MTAAADPATGWRLAFRLARRELRGGLKGFRLMMACLALGVGAIAAIGSFSATIDEALRNDARVLLGGDAELRLSQRPASAEERAFLSRSGDLSAVAHLRAMAAGAPGEDGTIRRQLIELKSVDGAYPLFGAVRLDPAARLADALAATVENGETVHGAVAQAELPVALGIALGERFKIGEASFVLRAVLLRDPDSIGDGLKFGPSVIVSEAAFTESRLEQPGSIIRYSYRLRFAPGVEPEAFKAQVQQAFPDAGWRIRFIDEAAPRLDNIVERANLFFTFIGLMALLVGGIGVANAVKSYLDGKIETVATLKCLGAPAGLIFRVYLLQVLAMALGGIAIGLAVGAVIPAAGLTAAGQLLPVDLHFAIHAEPLALAALYGILTALAFALWPLGRAREIPPAHLFRDLVGAAWRRPRPAVIAATALTAAALMALAYVSASHRTFALYFILGVIGALLVFRIFAEVLRLMARLAGRLASTGFAGRALRWPLLNFSLANIYRPGAPTGIILLSFGMGLTLLVTLIQLEGNLGYELRQKFPAQAPSFFFIDIQPDQVAEFDRIVAAVPGVREARRMPSLRGRIIGVNGQTLTEDSVLPGARWALRGDRGLTYSATLPADSWLAQGQWWRPDYQGPPLISLDFGVAQNMRIGVGDTMTFNILGREITATIANLRYVNYLNLNLNFSVIFAPGTLEAAPQTHLATVEADRAAEPALREAVLSRFSNVSAIHVRDTVESLTQVLENIAGAARAAAALAMVVGTLVLAGAIAAGRRARIYDAVVLKVLGATRRNILIAYAVEYALLGLAASVIAGALGVLASKFIISRMWYAQWIFMPESVIVTVVICTLAVTAFGFIGTWRALGRKASPILRAP